MVSGRKMCKLDSWNLLRSHSKEDRMLCLTGTEDMLRTYHLKDLEY